MAEEIKDAEMKNEQNQDVSLDELKKQIRELSAQNEKLKKSVDNACSDAANHKRSAAEWQEKYREKLSDEERAAAEKAEKEAALQAELEAYKTKDRINGYKSKFMGLGYDEESAAQLATSLPDGITEDFFATQKQFLDNKIQAMRVSGLNNQSGLTDGKPPAPNSDTQTARLRELMGLPTLG